MSWYNPFTWQVVTGVDLTAEQARAEKIDQQRQALDEQAIRDGKWDDAALRQVEINRQAEAAAGYDSGYDAQVSQAAAEGAKEGLSTMQSGVKDTLTGAATFGLQSVLGFVPWWVWLLGLAYLGWQVGAFKGFLKRA